MSDHATVTNWNGRIAVAGTGKEPDMGLVIKPISASRFFDLEVTEVIAKP